MEPDRSAAGHDGAIGLVPLNDGQNHTCMDTAGGDGHVIGRTALPGRLSAVLEQPPIRLAGRVLLAGLVGFSLFVAVRSSVDILSI